MRAEHPFTPADLAELDQQLLSRAEQVIALQEVRAGNTAVSCIGLRHDVDGGHALETAVRMAEWEAERGYRSTYFVLHTSPYWGRSGFQAKLERIAECGHEIGIHTNALAESLRTGRDPDLILEEALETLRGFGFPVRGVAGHGDPFCNRDRGEGEPTFANDEQFLECARPGEGLPDRLLNRGQITLNLAPRPLSDFGLEYEALWLGLPLPWRTSDSGGRWLFPFEETCSQFEAVRTAVAGQDAEKQLHLLVHPDWWGEAFASVEVAA